MNRVAIIVKGTEQQYEGLRTSVGLLLAGMAVQLFILHYEIENMDEAFHDNMAYMDEIGGKRFSNNSENAEKYGFNHITVAEAAARIKLADMIIPL